MCDDGQQIWQSGEYQLFPIGMRSAEEEFSFAPVFFTSFFTSDYKAEVSLFLA
jgi:hypothetical protein